MASIESRLGWIKDHLDGAGEINEKGQTSRALSRVVAAVEELMNLVEEMLEGEPD